MTTFWGLVIAIPALSAYATVHRIDEADRGADPRREARLAPAAAAAATTAAHAGSASARAGPATGGVPIGARRLT
ncbi:MAG: hypothetical protein U0575_15920 [Phycisphaerales bacterium]